MPVSMGWYVALGGALAAALWNSRRPGEMNETRDRAYVECLSGRVPVEKMRELAAAFEKARCYPQAKMLRLRIALEDLPPETKALRREQFAKGMASKKPDAVLRLASAFEAEGATTSAAKLRKHAEQLVKALTEAQPIVTPPPEPVAPAGDSYRVQTDFPSIQDQGRLTSDTPTVNGADSHVAVPPSALAN